MVPQHSQDGIMFRPDFDNSNLVVSSSNNNNNNNSSVTMNTVNNDASTSPLNMLVQQQQQQPLQSNRLVFGSQLVDKNSSTPYSDATQVSK